MRVLEESLLRNKVAAACNTVELAQASHLFIHWLILEHLGVLGKHILQNNLVEHALVVLGFTVTSVLLVARSIAASTLCLAHI
jgi:hypothetical protein